MKYEIGISIIENTFCVDVGKLTTAQFEFFAETKTLEEKYRFLKEYGGKIDFQYSQLRLSKRYVEGVHPCLLLALKAFMNDEDIFILYDGDHVMATNYADAKHLTYNYARWNNLRSYGFDTIRTSFKDLNDEELMILRHYFR